MTAAPSLVTLLATLAISAGSNAQARPDFSGRWKLDTTIVMGGGRGDALGNASGGGGGGGGGTGLGPPAHELNVEQSDTTIKVAQSGSGDEAILIVYRLDGKKVRNSMPIGRGRTTEATYVSRWDGSHLLTAIVRTVTARGGGVRLEYRESRYLASDGSMVVQTNMLGRPAGRTAVYQRLK